MKGNRKSITRASGKTRRRSILRGRGNGNYLAVSIPLTLGVIGAGGLMYYIWGREGGETTKKIHRDRSVADEGKAEGLKAFEERLRAETERKNAKADSLKKEHVEVLERIRKIEELRKPVTDQGKIKNARRKLGLKDENYNIFVAGKSGAGKSFFINAVIERGKPSGEAEVSISEVDTSIVSYHDNDKPNILYWDSPGFDTENVTLFNEEDPNQDFYQKHKVYAYDLVLIFYSGMPNKVTAEFYETYKNDSQKFFIIHTMTYNKLKDYMEYYKGFVNKKEEMEERLPRTIRDKLEKKRNSEKDGSIIGENDKLTKEEEDTIRKNTLDYTVYYIGDYEKKSMRDFYLDVLKDETEKDKNDFKNKVLYYDDFYMVDMRLFRKYKESYFDEDKLLNKIKEMADKKLQK